MFHGILKLAVGGTEMAKEFTRQHEVVYYECDRTGSMTIPMLISIAIRISEEQSDQLNRGTDFIQSFGVTWILTNYHVMISRLPQVGETVSVTTKAQEYNKYFCYRTFWFYDEAGNELVKIESVFALMDIHTRKMSRVTEEIIAPFESEKISKIRRFGQLTKLDKEKPYTQLPYRVRFYDIDSNQHVNNAIYFNWILDALGYDFLNQHQPKSITIRYEKEVSYGNQIDSLVQIDETTICSRHLIQVGDDRCCEAEIEWQKK